MTAEIESDARDTVDQDRKWFVDFNVGKNRTVRFWNSLPIKYFRLTYDRSGFKFRVNRHLTGRFSLNRFRVCFNLFVLHFLVSRWFFSLAWSKITRFKSLHHHYIIRFNKDYYAQFVEFLKINMVKAGFNTFCYFSAKTYAQFMLKFQCISS